MELAKPLYLLKTLQRERIMDKLEIDHFLAWKNLSIDLKVLKEQEAKARRLLCGYILGGDTGEFKEVIELDGHKITATSKISRTLDQGIVSALMSEMTDEDKSALRFKPALDLKAYRKLPLTSILHEAVTEKPAMPTLSVEYND